MTQPGGGSFVVDIAQAPKAIRELEEAREELQRSSGTPRSWGRSILQHATRSASMPPRSWDRSASGGPTSFVEALTAGIEEISRMIEALRSGFAAYERGDQSASSEFVQSP